MDSIQLVKSISVRYPLGRCLPPILLLTLYKLSLFCNYDFELFIIMLDTFLKVRNYIFFLELDTINVSKKRAHTNIKVLSPKYSLPYRISYISDNIDIEFIICNKCGNYVSCFLTTCCISFLQHAKCNCYR